MLDPRRLGAMIWKEGLNMRRDKNTLRLLLLMPVIQVILYGYAIDTDVKHLPTAIFDEDRSAMSRRLICAFVQSQYFDIAERVTDSVSFRRSLDLGEVKAALHIPPGFSRDVLAGRTAALQLAVDGTDSTPATAASANGGLIVAAFEQREGLVSSATPIDMRTRMWYNPELKSPLFFIPGLIGFLLGTLVPFALIAAVVGEKEKGTIEQLIVTPLTRWEIILGKLIPFTLVGMVAACSVLAAGRLLFGLHIRGSLPLLLVLTLVYLIVTLGIGLFASAVSETTQAATTIVSTTIAPSILLSGFFFPRETMPAVIRLLSNFIPLTYYLQIIRGIALKGLGALDLWRQILALAAMAVFIMSLAVVKFRKRLS